MLLRRIVDLAVPAAVALIAFLHAQAIGALIGSRDAPAAIAPFAEARAATTSEREKVSADVLLARNPFEHGTTPGRDKAEDDVPPCDGVRAVATVRTEDADASFAALQSGGRGFLRRAGSELPRSNGTDRIVAVGHDRVWLERDGRICVVQVFGQTAAPPRPAPPPNDFTRHVAKTGPHEFHIDRGALERLLDAQSELTKTPLVPESDGVRLVRVRPGSALAALGLEANDRLVSINGLDLRDTERMLEAYARLRTGVMDRLTLRIVRNGRPIDLDYVVR